MDKEKEMRHLDIKVEQDELEEQMIRAIDIRFNDAVKGMEKQSKQLHNMNMTVNILLSIGLCVWIAIMIASQIIKYR